MLSEISYGTVIVIGTVILGLLIAYGIYQSRTRNRANDPITDAATREVYRHPKE